jgi:hypothetical protein
MIIDSIDWIIHKIDWIYIEGIIIIDSDFGRGWLGFRSKSIFLLYRSFGQKKSHPKSQIIKLKWIWSRFEVDCCETTTPRNILKKMFTNRRAVVVMVCKWIGYHEVVRGDEMRRWAVHKSQNGRMWNHFSMTNVSLYQINLYSSKLWK